MNIAIKILLEGCKEQKGCYGRVLKLDPQLYDLLVQEVRTAGFIFNGNSGCWITTDLVNGRPTYMWAYGTKVTFSRTASK